jgi:hypothetical protein
VDVHLDLLLNLTIAGGRRNIVRRTRDALFASCYGWLYLHGVNFDDLATSEHAQVEVVVLIDCHAAAKDLLDLSVLVDVEEDLLVV